ncbi:MAG: ABC transporter ATP-binding protein [Gemmatimonadota bacterium]|nr:ABC transporter ATP-binding protein [Gemmatimonadota bacterium]
MTASVEAGSLAVELAGLSKRFGWNRVLRGIDLRVERGTTLALVGPNGAGKTTLLKCLATLLRPSGGEGTVCGFSLRSHPDEIRERTGLLTVRGYVYDELTAEENLRFTARMSGLRVPGATLESELERVGLARAAGQRVRTFSTGMRKRLVLAQLRIRRIELALLDEPYAGLDTEGMALVDAYVRECRDEGITVLLASHQAGEATRRAEQTALLRDGRLHFVDHDAAAATHLSARDLGVERP